MGTDDEFTAEEMAYIESGGKTPLPEVTPSDPPAGSQPAPDAQPDAAAAAAAQPSGPPEVGVDEADGDEVLPSNVRAVPGKDGRIRLVDESGKFVKSVSHRALHKEREGHKQTKAELQKERELRARIDERVAILNEAFNAARTGAQPPAPNGQPPQPGQGAEQGQNPFEEADIDPEVDLFAAFKQQQRRNAYLQHQMTSSTQQQTVRETFNHVQNTYRSDAIRLAQEKPEFTPAYNFLVAGRHAELEALGVTDKAQRDKEIARDEAAIVINALKANKSPAQAVYDLAVARGFKAAAASVPAANGSQPPSQQHRPTASASPAAAAAEKLKQIRAGQTAAATLSNSGGSPHEGLTSEALANMSDEQFSAAVDRLSESDLRSLMGR